jgi:S1-C subfamily serine protease
MVAGLTVALAIVLAVVGAVEAVPRTIELRAHPGKIPTEPSYLKRVEPAIVGLRVRADEAAFSSNRLGSRRFGSGVIFDRDGYVLTVSYILLDAVSIEAVLRDGRTVPAQLAGLDLESGLGVVRLAEPGPWPAATLGQSADAVPGMLTGTIGVDEDNELVYVTGSVQGVRRFSSFWEYMLDRALLITPASSSWGGSAVVDTTGNVIGVASLRVGEAPYVNLAIPIEKFVPVKDELIAAGRVVSRRPRPWLGLYTAATTGGVVVEGVAPVGPAANAGFRKGDRIVSVNGVTVESQEHFYEVLWRGQAGDVVRIAVQRGAARHVIAVASIDRYRLLRSSPR